MKKYQKASMLMVAVALVAIVLMASNRKENAVKAENTTFNAINTEDVKKEENLLTTKAQELKISKLQASKMKTKRITLKWEGPTEADIKYEVARAVDNKEKFRIISKTDKLTYNDSKVKRGHIYYYKIRIVTTSKKSSWSKVISVANPMKGVSKISFTRYSTSSVILKWKKQQGAKYYKIYRAQKGSKKYKCIKTTSALQFRDKGLKNNTTYYYKIRACVGKKRTAKDSELSKAASFNTKTYSRVTVFAGDSIFTGLSPNIYNGIGDVAIGGSKKVVASIGLSTGGFYSKREFGGMTGVEKVCSYKPYRVYMMLGMNEIEYVSPSSVVNNYKKIVAYIKKHSPSTDIVILSVSPVGRSTASARPGFQKISSLNNSLKQMAKKYGISYFDFSPALKDSSGYLKYGGGDGIHWSKAGYQAFGKMITRYDLKKDK